MQQVMRNPRRTRWNKGKWIGPKPWLRQKYAWTIRTKLQIEQRKCVIWHAAATWLCSGSTLEEDSDELDSDSPYPLNPTEFRNVRR